jgi:hypothetical protein
MIALVSFMRRFTVRWLPLAILLAGCAATGPKDKLWEVGVPDSFSRFVYELGADPDAEIEKAISQAICLIRSGDLPDCSENPQPETICNDRTNEEVDAAIRPAFEAIVRLKLTSAAMINADIARLIPGAYSTTQVADARRSFLCREWRNEDGACVAIRVDVIWILLHASPGGDGSADRFEVFLAEPTCGDIPPGSQS